MSLIIETHIICDSCGNDFGIDMRHLKGFLQRKSAKLQGWIYSGNKDLCPDCRPINKKGNYHSKKSKT